ncbi:hypothetical protein DL96DRAFT_1278949 [Flagelloscypha sp. PMI_526]|nr:hypothetical protein DL96DRAFT_1278949 [Flagelloscypha sp. PMI_526]
MIAIMFISWVPICLLAGGRFIITIVTNRWATEATEEMDAAHLWASTLAGFFFSLFMITGFLVMESDWWQTHKQALPQWILEPEYVCGQVFSAGLVSCALGGAIYGEKDERISGMHLVLEYCSSLAAFGVALFLTMFFMWLNSLCLRRQKSSSIPR